MGGATAAPGRPGGPWLPVLVVAVAILVASVVPSPGPNGPVPGPPGVAGADALLHAVGYGLLAAAIAGTLVATGRSTVAVLALAIVATMAFGLAVELLQAPLPTRRFDTGDLLANGFGVVVALSALLVAARLGRGPLSSSGP